jgi:acyl-CoA reductase-like NAD-dependent aldehyde dehydrogenase
MTAVNARPTRIGHHIGGTHLHGEGSTFDVIAPATGELLATVEEAGPGEVDAAVDAAAGAATVWQATRTSSKVARLNRWADAISAHRDELAVLESMESGKPLGFSSGMIAAAAAQVRHLAGWCDKLRSSHIPLDPDTLCYTELEPYGVVGAIIPWNFPAGNFVGKVAPALVAGNAVVVKPAEQTPLVAMRLAELSEGCGFPPGLVNVVNGQGPGAGRLLVGHPDVKKIAFTGSTATGLEITRSTGAAIKSFTLELGGKSANIVMADADLDAALEASVFTAFLHAGQVCTSGSRLLLHESIAEPFIERLVRRAESLRVGDPGVESTQIGPIITAAQLEQVEAKVATAIEEGARLLTGGSRLRLPGLEGGNYFAPTIFTDVKPDSMLFTTEVFGPVLSVSTFADLDEAISLANATDYGLAAILWTSNLATAHQGASRLRAGIVWVNTAQRLDNAVPYGGYRQSGIGLESGIEGVHDYLQTKAVFMGTGRWSSPWR